MTERRPVTGMSVRNWRADGLPDDVRYLLDLLRDWQTCIMIDGSFTVKIGESEGGTHIVKSIHRNHLKSMLRREYLEQKRFLSGARLDKFLKKFLDGIHTVANNEVSKDSQVADILNVDVLDGTI